MSDNIPLELQVEIIKRVPVKSLLQLRSVSKEWKALIDSPKFADDYCLRQSQPHRLLISYLPYDTSDYKNKDKDTSCMAVWNPWIRKFVDVPVPNVLYNQYNSILGFGVSPQTKDLKIVKINSLSHFEINTSDLIPWRIEVFSLSSGAWKTPSCGGINLPCRNSIRFCWSQVALDRVIYWHAFEMIKVDGIPHYHNLIMSFDLSSEGFEEVCLPNNLAHVDIAEFSISKRIESVVVLEMDNTRTSCGVWMMGQGVTKSFTKLFNVLTQGSYYYIVSGFMKNGEPIVDHGSDVLFSYDPYSKRIKDLGIVGRSFTFSVNSYVETLLLIDR